MTRTPQELVTEFHTAFGVPVGDLANPTANLGDRIELRRRLVEEEYGEVDDASWSEEPCDICGDHGGPWVKDIAALAKELADLVYVCYGWAVEMGVDLDAVLAEVHRSNMSKLDPTTGRPVLREDGKVLKGAAYSPANIEAVLGTQAERVRRLRALEEAVVAALAGLE